MRDTVRVRRIRALVCDTGQGRSFVFVIVDTDAGVSGVGEASQSDQDQAVVANVRLLAPLYEGHDVFDLVERRAGLYRSDRAGRAMMVAASGIEIALWDAIGKLLDVPVYQLLGGSCHERLRCYATIAAGVDDWTPDGLARVAQQSVAEGFTAVKIVPFDSGAPSAHAGMSLERFLQAGVDRVAAVREAVGSDVGIMIECAFGFDRATAVEVGRALEPYHCFWLEAPLWWDDPGELASLRAALPQRVASGEALHGRRAYRGIIEGRAVDVLQPDVKWTGGILEARKIAAWAEAYQLSVAPHNNSGPVATAASAHLGMSLPNCLVLEAPALRPSWEDDLVAGTYPIRRGFVSAETLGERSGLGLEFDEVVAAANLEATNR